jgi:hypothetical protein
LRQDGVSATAAETIKRAAIDRFKKRPPRERASAFG